MNLLMTNQMAPFFHEHSLKSNSQWERSGGTKIPDVRVPFE